MSMNLTKTESNKSMQERPEQERRERIVTPRASVFETENAVILELEIPGVSRDTIDVTVENDELTVTGRRVFPVDEGAEMLHQERLPFNYRRSFILSERIDSANIGANYTDGVLKLTLPKSAEAKPRKITIE